MLIDELQQRADSVEILSIDGGFSFNGAPSLTLSDHNEYPIKTDALDDLLNILRVPTKYIRRCLESLNGDTLAIANVNHWLCAYSSLSALLEDNIIVQIFEGKKSYFPSWKINDFIVEKLGGDVEIIHSQVDDDIFTATYMSKKVGIKVLFSDCFIISPRIDGVYLYDGALYVVPIKGRKFRVADKDLSAILDQFDEFCNIVSITVQEELIPALKNFKELPDVDEFVDRLCADLRLNHKVMEEIKSTARLQQRVPRAILRALKGGSMSLDIETCRQIQIAITNYIINGSFK